MDIQKINPTQVAVKWALIYLLLEIILTYIWKIFNIDLGIGFWGICLHLFPVIAFTFLTQRQYRDQLNGDMTFDEGFSAGFRFTVISTLLIAAFIYLYLSLFSPDIFEKSLTHIRTRLVLKGRSPQHIEKQIRDIRRFGPGGFAFLYIIMQGITGILISLVGAAIFKRKKTSV